MEGFKSRVLNVNEIIFCVVEVNLVEMPRNCIDHMDFDSLMY